LLGALPDMVGPRRRLSAIPGGVPEPWNLPPGCAFAPRCGDAIAACAAAQPAFQTVGPAHLAACIRVNEPVAAEPVPA
jgi:peptide/nickel transport system ATP-binding protein